MLTFFRSYPHSWLQNITDRQTVVLMFISGFWGNKEETELLSTITIEIFPAQFGESFLVTIEGQEKTYILIDMGFSTTYNSYIKPRLQQISSEGNAIDLLVFTHIDRDHILGGISFLQENGTSSSPLIVPVKEIWFNSLRHLQFDKRGGSRISEEDNIVLGRILAKGIPSESQDLSYGLVSAIQGSALGALILRGEYNWNSMFHGEAVCLENNLECILNNEISIKLLSPRQIDLKMLDYRWQQDLYVNKGFKGEITRDTVFDDAFEMLLGQSFDERLRSSYKLIGNQTYNSYIDLKSYMNLGHHEDNCGEINSSSIAFILECDGKKVLFLGDSNPLNIAENLRNLYTGKIEFPLFFDAIKVAHHGSKYNTTTDLLELVDSNNFIISTNGACYGHPDIESIAKIVCRNEAEPKNLAFSYDSVANKFEIEAWRKKYNYSIVRSNTQGTTLVL